LDEPVGGLQRVMGRKDFCPGRRVDRKKNVGGGKEGRRDWFERNRKQPYSDTSLREKRNNFDQLHQA